MDKQLHQHIQLRCKYSSMAMLLTKSPLRLGMDGSLHPRENMDVITYPCPNTSDHVGKGVSGVDIVMHTHLSISMD